MRYSTILLLRRGPSRHEHNETQRDVHYGYLSAARAMNDGRHMRLQQFNQFLIGHRTNAEHTPGGTQSDRPQLFVKHGVRIEAICLCFVAASQQVLLSLLPPRHEQSSRFYDSPLSSISFVTGTLGRTTWYHYASHTSMSDRVSIRLPHIRASVLKPMFFLWIHTTSVSIFDATCLH